MRPIFIIGNPRSGTTLFRLILTCHPNICVPPECGWLIGLYNKWGSKTLFEEKDIDDFILDLCAPSTRKFETLNLDLNKLKQNLLGSKDYRDISDRVYKTYSEQYKPTATRWGDKNNFFLHYIESIDSLFPEAVFIHIVRNGRDVACSYRELRDMEGRYAPRLPDLIGDIGYRWSNNLSTIEDSLRRIDYRRSLVVRYEDLVLDTFHTLNSVCSFLGEPFDDKIFSEMSLFYQKNIDMKLEPDETMPWKALTKNPITVSKIDRWRKELTKDEISLFESVAKEQLIHYGYLEGK